MYILKHLNLIERIDQLIRLNATGTPTELASKLNISKTTVHRVISLMRDMNAPIYYDDKEQSYVYEQEVTFTFGFHHKNAETETLTGFRKVANFRKKMMMNMTKNQEKFMC